MYKVLFIFLLAFSTAKAQSPMNIAEATALRTKVKEKAASTKTITSEVIQYTHLDFLSYAIEAKG